MPWLGQHSRIYRDTDLRDDDGGLREANAAPAELTIDIMVSNNGSRVLKIGSQLNSSMMKELASFL